MRQRHFLTSALASMLVMAMAPLQVNSPAPSTFIKRRIPQSGGAVFIKRARWRHGHKHRAYRTR